MSGYVGSVGARLATIAERLQARATGTFGERLPVDVVADLAELQRLAAVVNLIADDLRALDRDLATASRALREGDA